MLFSVQHHRTVAEIAMEDSGASLDVAAEKFSSKLSATIPNVTCSEWNWRALTPRAPRPFDGELTTAWMR